MSFAIGFLTHAKFDKKELDMNIQTINANTWRIKMFKRFYLSVAPQLFKKQNLVLNIGH